MVIAPAKTKLRLTSNNQIKTALIKEFDFRVKVLDNEIRPMPSEKLLGVILSDDMTWLPHMWGESWRDKDNARGLIPDLIKRIGLLRYLARGSSRSKIKSLVAGMFTSKILYGLPLVSSIWGLQNYNYELNKLSCPKSAMIKLQSCQRQTLFFLGNDSNMNTDLPTVDLLRITGSLSVHQMAAMHIIRLGLRILRFQKPKYLYNMMIKNPRLGRQSDFLIVPVCRLNITHEGFINQAVRLLNKLPEDIRSDQNLVRQKKSVKEWVLINIKVKV